MKFGCTASFGWKTISWGACSARQAKPLGTLPPHLVAADDHRALRRLRIGPFDDPILGEGGIDPRAEPGLVTPPLQALGQGDLVAATPLDREAQRLVEVSRESTQRPASDERAQALRIGQRGGDDLGTLLDRVVVRPPGSRSILEAAEPSPMASMEPDVDRAVGDADGPDDLAGAATVGEGQEGRTRATRGGPGRCATPRVDGEPGAFRVPAPGARCGWVPWVHLLRSTDAPVRGGERSENTWTTGPSDARVTRADRVGWRCLHGARAGNLPRASHPRKDSGSSWSGGVRMGTGSSILHVHLAPGGGLDAGSDSVRTFRYSTGTEGRVAGSS
jgi:hypothetical protein